MGSARRDLHRLAAAVGLSALGDVLALITLVLAVERNTKYLDPMIHDQMSET